MANKHVLAPCTGSGHLATDDLSLHYIDRRSNSVKTPCPFCNQLVSIGKANKRLRMHNGVGENIERDS